MNKELSVAADARSNPRGELNPPVGSFQLRNEHPSPRPILFCNGGTPRSHLT